jgi:hypothetical protein
LFPRIGRATRSPQKQHAPLCAGFSLRSIQPNMLYCLSSPDWAA